MPLKAIGNPELMEKYRCKVPAYWTFRATKRVSDYPQAKSGHYCMHHLHSLGIFYSPPEQDRFEKWYKKWLEDRET
jgi:hypothetical protein